MAAQISLKHLVVFFIFFSFTIISKAEVKPLYEIGAFLGHGSLADYPASDERRYLTLPFPFLNYRGELLSSDNESGTRLRFIKDANFDFDLSFGGSFPTQTNENKAREGMPNLDWTLEIGPRLLYYFYRDSQWGNIRIGIPIRKSISTDFQTTRDVGYIFAPTFQIDRYHILGEQNLDLYFIMTLNYLNEGEARFFYQVDPQYQTLERKSYQAKDGFLGTDYSLSFKYEHKQKIFLVGANYSDFSSSANRESFLHRADSSWSYFVGFGWIFFESEEKVDN